MRAALCKRMFSLLVPSFVLLSLFLCFIYLSLKSGIERGAVCMCNMQTVRLLMRDHVYIKQYLLMIHYKAYLNHEV